jgi:hypothetical protein
MADPLRAWVDRDGREGPIRHLPLELALDVVDVMTQPEDIISYALANPDVLRYWLKLGQDLLKRYPGHMALEDLESTIRADPALPDFGLMLVDPKRGIIFENFAKNTMRRLFSVDIQLNLMLILYMPNPSHRVWDFDYRRANHLGDNRPYALLLQRREARFKRLYIEKQYGKLLFSWMNFNRISPLCKAVYLFATDYTKKALSEQPIFATHSAPTFAHESLLNYPDDTWRRGAQLRDSSPIQSLECLHEVEQERLRLAFFQYECLCVTSTKITGYWEIDDLITRQYGNYDGWNDARTARSVLASGSLCQAERVNTVYRYIRQLYLLMFWTLWDEYTRLVREMRKEYPEGEVMRPHTSEEMPPIFGDRPALLEWIDVLCSRGLVFLSEILKMNADQRRSFFVSTFHPTKAKRRLMPTAHHLVRGAFASLEEMFGKQGKLIVSLNDYTDLDPTAPNLGWCAYWGRGLSGFSFDNSLVNTLRHSGYVFWETRRCVERKLDKYDSMDYMTTSMPFNHDFCGGIDALDSINRLEMTEPQWVQFKAQLPEAGWVQAREVFYDPTTPSVVHFGILDETWRIAENTTEDGYPIEPDYFR